MKIFNFLFIFLVLAFTPSAFSADPKWDDLEKQLKGTGLSGWIHGASEPLSLFVFTYREPGNFFSHVEFPLIAGSEGIERTLRTLTRHDEVSLKGYFLENGAPIRHIFVESLSLIKKYESPLPQSQDPYPYQATLPDELLNKSEIFVKVHAVANEGKVLVVEYKDAVLPVVISQPTLSKGLFRNDKVKLKVRVRSHPEQPTHVSLDTSKPEPLVVTDRMVDWHGKKGSVEGALVLFPKSPQVNFNVFALQLIDENGVAREFTLVNFEDDVIFSKIRQKLQNFWDAAPAGVENARNKLINRQVKLRATGTFNVVDPGQANPQILLTSPEAIISIQN